MIEVPRNGREARATRCPTARKLDLQKRRAEAVRRAAFYREQLAIEQARFDQDAATVNAEHYFRQLAVIEGIDEQLARFGVTS